MMRAGRADKQYPEVIMRAALGPVCMAVISTACAARVLALDGDDAGHGSQAGTATSGGGAAPSVTAQSIVTCANPDDMPATLGNGYSTLRPAACTAQRGATKTFGAVVDVMASLVGTWLDCSGGSFGLELYGAVAMQFTSDGRYVADGAEGSTLESLSSIPVASSGGSSDNTSSSSTGTYTVVDGSATYGAGTYELQLRPTSGGLYTGQVIFSDSPLQLVFLPPNQSEQVFTAPLPWSPRKGVCSCVNVDEKPVYQDDATGLTSAILGKWIWCGGSGEPMGDENIGVEFAAGNTWYGLTEDANGNVTRSTADIDHGTFEFTPTEDDPAPTSSLNIRLTFSSEYTDTSLLYFTNPRALLLGNGTSSIGFEAPMTDYSVCFPMP
jgi:hypothetical protein